MRVSLLVIAVALVVAGCGGSSHHVGLTVTPSSSAEDQPLTIRLSGLRGHEHVTVTVRSTDADGVAFAAHASFVADGKGNVDLARQAPQPGGSYTTAWKMGLIASMVAGQRSPFAYYAWWGDRPRTFRLSASSNGRTLASTTFQRRWSNVKYTERKLTVAKDGIDGTFYAPTGAHRSPAVLAFGGSEGAIADRGGTFSSRLALHGIPTLFVGYFHGPGLPDKLVNIPLEYFHRALLWLDRQPQVNPDRVSLFTGSYGSEAALLLGVHYPTLIHGIAATVPGSVVTCGILGADRAGQSTKQCLGSPWTFHGKPLAHTTLYNNPQPWDNPRAVIPVEKIHTRLLLACGGHDQVWSSCPFAQAIVARRKRHGEQTTLYVYPNAGHFVGSPEITYEPGAMASDLFTPWDARGRADLWPRVIDFLQAAH